MGRGTELQSERAVSALVVDDDPSLLDLVTRTLRASGLSVRSASSMAGAMRVLDDFAPEVAVLDVMLPDGSGLELSQHLRARHEDLRVIFLTARDSVPDRLAGFAVGGDDYVTKPFSVAELVARISAVLRRGRAGVGGSTLEAGDLVLDDEAHAVARAGTPIELSPTEYRLLRYLLLNCGRVVSKEQILSQVWQYDHYGDATVVEKFISQLRKKVDEGREPLIHTVRGFGYVVRASA